MRLKITIPQIFIITLFCLFVVQSCRIGADLEADGALLSHSGCKNFDNEASQGRYTLSDSSHECLEYSYAGNVLRIKHINAAFNCCLDKITGSVGIEGNIIRIESNGILTNGQGCFCDCLYDVEFEVKNLLPAVYRIVCSTFTHSLEIDLTQTTSDRYCEPRDHYPWN